MPSIVLACIVTAVVLLNVVASVAVVRDSALTSAQRRLQLALIWILPVVGAALTYFLRGLMGRASPRLTNASDEQPHE